MGHVSQIRPIRVFRQDLPMKLVGNTYWRRQWQPTPVLLPGKSHGWRSLVACSPWVAKSRTRLSNFTCTFHFHALEKEMATHSSILAWRIPGMGEPDGLPSMGSHRVGHDWSDLAAAAAGNTFNQSLLLYNKHSQNLSGLWHPLFVFLPIVHSQMWQRLPLGMFHRFLYSLWTGGYLGHTLLRTGHQASRNMWRFFKPWPEQSHCDSVHTPKASHVATSTITGKIPLVGGIAGVS